jgi:hypothetical protein
MTDGQLDAIHNEAIQLKENGYAPRSIAASNLVIIELLARLINKEDLPK